MALEAALAVQQQLQERVDEVERLRSHQVERARYKADLARRRFMKVDPENRLVADELEAEWNRKLRVLSEAQEEAKRQSAPTVLDEAQRARILALATDLPRLWREPTTPDRERKRMVRLLIEDITLTRESEVIAAVRFKGGATTMLKVPPALSSWQLRQTRPEVIAAIDELLAQHTDAEIARRLNERSFQTGSGKAFTPWTIYRLRRDHKLRTLYSRLRAAGMLDQSEIATRLGVLPATIKIWRRAGLLKARAYNDKRQYLYAAPDGDAPIRKKHKGISEWQRRHREMPVDPSEEVQCEA